MATTKDHLEETYIHNNMVLNEEFATVMNVVMDQNPGSILYKAFRDEAVSNVPEIMSLSAYG